MHWVSHSFYSDLTHKFRRSIIKSPVTNTAVVEKPAPVSCVGRVHSGSSGTAGFQLPPRSLHSCTDVWAYFISGAKLSGCSVGLGLRGAWGLCGVCSGGRAEPGSLGLSHPQPGAGQPGGTGTALAPSIRHLCGDRDRPRLGQNVGPQVRVSIKTLYLSVLNFMKFLLV